MGPLPGPLAPTWRSWTMCRRQSRNPLVVRCGESDGGVLLSVADEVRGVDLAPAAGAVVVDDPLAGQQPQWRRRRVEHVSAERGGHAVGRRRRRGRAVVEPTSRPGFWWRRPRALRPAKGGARECGRSYATPCIHENSCLRCPLLRPDPAERPRLVEIRDNLLTNAAFGRNQRSVTASAR